MNQTQRQFLLNAIDQQYKREHQALQKKRPPEPSLNSYLIAAILDGSFKLKSEKIIREEIRLRVRKLGKSQALISSTDTWRERHDRDEGDGMVAIPAGVLFELPDEYKKERSTYESELAEWQQKADALSASFEAMRIKTQLGSDKALSALVDEADKLCSMSLTDSSKLFITNGNS